ncbi:mRNA export factor GLE1-like isoform X1 [Lethenteron reissneri]|uniref:mRNA export factor GLE1-like isoform X1 n=1 Tax=Lethenteron reissneri TaxID=7753 RepID=UPI002AB6CBED|nr:mRNA export factor GLE1-like isoform X1 [Lethenteron reissneri]
MGACCSCTRQRERPRKKRYCKKHRCRHNRAKNGIDDHADASSPTTSERSASPVVQEGAATSGSCGKEAPAECQVIVPLSPLDIAGRPLPDGDVEPPHASAEKPLLLVEEKVPSVEEAERRDNEPEVRYCKKHRCRHNRAKNGIDDHADASSPTTTERSASPVVQEGAATSGSCGKEAPAECQVIVPLSPLDIAGRPLPDGDVEPPHASAEKPLLLVEEKVPSVEEAERRGNEPEVRYCKKHRCRHNRAKNGIDDHADASSPTTSERSASPVVQEGAATSGSCGKEAPAECQVIVPLSPLDIAGRPLPDGDVEPPHASAEKPLLLVEEKVPSVEEAERRDNEPEVRHCKKHRCRHNRAKNGIDDHADASSPTTSERSASPVVQEGAATSGSCGKEAPAECQVIVPLSPLDVAGRPLPDGDVEPPHASAEKPLLLVEEKVPSVEEAERRDNEPEVSSENVILEIITEEFCSGIMSIGDGGEDAPCLAHECEPLEQAGGEWAESSVPQRRHDELQRHLAETVESLKELNGSQDLETKVMKFELAKASSIPVNQISNTSGSHLRVITDKLDLLLSGKAVVSGTRSTNVSDHPQGLLYVLHRVTERLVKQCEEEVGWNHAAAFPIAAVTVELWHRHPAIGELLFAELLSKCPYLAPFFPRPTPGQSQEDAFRILGHRFEDGTLEDEDLFLQRMSGMARLYAAIVSAPVSPSSGDKSHPHGVSHGWSWLTRVLDMEPMANVTPTVLFRFLEVAGSAMEVAYGDQLWELLDVLRKEYIPRIEKVSTPQQMGAVVRLRLFLEDCFVNREIPLPSGHLSEEFRKA